MHYRSNQQQSRPRNPNIMDVDRTQVRAVSATGNMFSPSTTQRSPQSKSLFNPQQANRTGFKPHPFRNASRQELADKGLCFYCRNKGHVKRDCEKWKKTQQRNPGKQTAVRSASIEIIEEKKDSQGFGNGRE
jgi:hypothetical protein